MSRLLFWLINQLIISIMVKAEGEITFPMYQYLANHLSENECNKLAAALHFHGYKLNNLHEAAALLPDNVNCLGLLLHWDKTPEQGKTASSEIVVHRLNQIGKKDLAKWLQKSLFQEFQQELEETPQLADKDVSFKSEFQTKSDITEWMEENDLKDNIMTISIVILIVGVSIAVVATLDRLIHICKKNQIVANKRIDLIEESNTLSEVSPLLQLQDTKV
uniref:Death domain-containing protein n=1 Tax=Clastoptera arizonana TaxID=38151 RepID=A0A1B6DR36_9HEMI